MRPSDPYSVFKFIVEVNGIEIGGFSDVSGVELKLETDDVREGGVNDFVHKIPKHTSYPNLTLKRGISDSVLLWAWCMACVQGAVQRQMLSVVLKDRQGHEKWRWIFLDAFPVKWSLSELNASANTVAVESVEFAHHGMIGL